MCEYNSEANNILVQKNGVYARTELCVIEFLNVLVAM